MGNCHMMRKDCAGHSCHPLGFSWPHPFFPASPSAFFILVHFLYFPKWLALGYTIICCLPPGRLPWTRKSQVEEEGLGLSRAGLLQHRIQYEGWDLEMTIQITWRTTQKEDKFLACSVGPVRCGDLRQSTTSCFLPAPNTPSQGFTWTP